MVTEDERTLVDALRGALKGRVIDSEHPEYDRARRVWNGLIDRHPAAIAKCADAADVAEAVRIARELGPVVSIRGGGHQVAGSAVCDDGLVIDLSDMNAVTVDHVARTAHVQAGALWADVDAATQEFGLMTPGGVVSTTGVAGLTLGGGMGAAVRKYGLSCDAVREIEIVTADGVVRTANANEHQDLLWASKGGGRGIGVVTSFTFDLYELGPEVRVALYAYPYEDAEKVLRAYREIAPYVNDEVTSIADISTLPDDPELPPPLRGVRICAAGGMYAGPVADADAMLQPFAELSTPLGDMGGVVPYTVFQSMSDQQFPPGRRYFMKSHFMDDLSDAAIATTLELDARRFDGDVMLVVRSLGGAVSRIGEDESAYAHRSAPFNLSIDTSWDDPSTDEAGIRWSRETWDALKPHSTGVYVNFAGLSDEIDAAGDAVLGSSAGRLASIRAKYDPAGLFEGAAHRP